MKKFRKDLFAAVLLVLAIVVLTLVSVLTGSPMMASFSGYVVMALVIALVICIAKEKNSNKTSYHFPWKRFALISSVIVCLGLIVLAIAKAWWWLLIVVSFFAILVAASLCYKSDEDRFHYVAVGLWILLILVAWFGVTYHASVLANKNHPCVPGVVDSGNADSSKPDAETSDNVDADNSKTEDEVSDADTSKDETSKDETSETENTDIAITILDDLQFKVTNTDISDIKVCYADAVTGLYTSKGIEVEYVGDDVYRLVVSEDVKKMSLDILVGVVSTGEYKIITLEPKYN